jgi:hypothetical protein
VFAQIVRLLDLWVVTGTTLLVSEPSTCIHFSTSFEAEHATGLLNADMDPHYSIIAAPVYSPIPIYTFDEDKVWEDEVSPIPPLFMNGGKNFVIDPLAWLLYVIEEETNEELIEFEMRDDK